MHAHYIHCSDGRTRFSYGWTEFALCHDLVSGVDAMMMFYINNATCFLKIVFHTLAFDELGEFQAEKRGYVCMVPFYSGF